MMLGLSALGFAYDENTAGVTGMDRNTGLRGQACGPGGVYTGQVVWTDPATQRLMVSGNDGSKIFDVSQAGMSSMPQLNQFVTVAYSEVNGYRIASSVGSDTTQVAFNYEGYAYDGPY